MAKAYEHEAIRTRLFAPSRGATLPVTDTMRPVDLQLADGTYVGGYWAGPLDQAPVLYVLLGRGDVVSDQLERWPGWAREAGANLFLIDYPGQGSSEGEGSFTSCRAAAHAGMNYLLSRTPDEVPAVVVLGRSLGSLFALDLVAANRDRLHGVILETAIASPAEWLDARIDWAACGCDREAALAELAQDFDPQAALSGLAAPLLVLQPVYGGELPVAEGELLATWGGGELALVKRGEHDNVPDLHEREYRAQLRAFFERLRERRPGEA